MIRLALAACLLAGAAQGETVTIPGPDGIGLRAELHIPAGAPTGPAVVALHGCGGAFGARDRQWTEALLRTGHIVLFPDSFGSRGLGSQCRERSRVATAGGLRRRDALAAADWLARRAGTPPGGVVVLGWSDGGSTVVATARADRRDLPADLIRGYVAFYPGCRVAPEPPWQPSAPMLILHGAADDWTPIAPCLALAAQAGPKLRLTAFPGAYHDFDAPGPVRVMRDIPSSQNADKSVHVGGDPAARAAALRQVPEFIDSLPPLPDRSRTP